MTFLLSFLGSLFALLVVVLLVYTYAQIKIRPLVEKLVKPFADASAAYNPAGKTDDQFIDGIKTGQAIVEDFERRIASGEIPKEARLGQCSECSDRFLYMFTCAEHGHCQGCPLVLEQFEAIARTQGAAMIPFERDVLNELRATFGPPTAPGKLQSQQEAPRG